MKKALLSLLICSGYISAFAQDCNTLTTDQSDFCWTKQFFINSPIHDAFDISFLKYNVGLNEYYPKGDYVPWGGYYMPLLYGGIATRWKISDKSYPKTSTLPSWDQIKSMSVDDISKLSPAEKMDIYMGNKDFSITKNELTRRGPERQNVEDWEGFCNGIRLAGASFPEPQKDILVKSKAGDNVFIKFFPADLKALGGAVYYYNEWYASLGENNKRKPNAGQFDILLRFALGNQKRNFFLDIKEGAQKWNETIVGYKRELTEHIPSAQDSAPNGTSKIADVKATLYLLGELGFREANSLTRPLIENKSLVKVWVTNYKLFINANNEIIDGRWIRKNATQNIYYLEYPDYVWFGSGKGTDELVIGNRTDNNILLPFFEVQNLFYLSVK